VREILGGAEMVRWKAVSFQLSAGGWFNFGSVFPVFGVKNLRLAVCRLKNGSKSSIFRPPVKIGKIF